ncbi:hypothetical protein [Roseomonas xinghualingensis]|uniref:hypothetical protein n=1 Tax=Roseomonas xinghualingensis TaxID=2986475 RepID=UPI0021F1023D|nr:hypothetical protein [Roseomonas sp. SXEYE001]MCV4207190.1 hypothetical protein [Roseomonas sp. SXEYE001]
MHRVVARAVDRVLARIPPAQREEALRVLREQMERTLTTAPFHGRPVEEMRVRACLAASLATYQPAIGSTEVPDEAPGQES